MNMKYYKDKVKEYLSMRPTREYAKYLKLKWKNFRYICIFGAGNMGIGLPVELKKHGIEVDFFCDNDIKKIGNIYGGIRCISLEELDQHKEDTIVIIATRYYKEIYQQLREQGYQYMDRVLDNKFAVDAYLKKANQADICQKLQQVIDILADEESAFVLSRIVQEWCRNDYQYGQLDDICSENQYFDNSVVEWGKEEIFVDCGAYTGDTLDSLTKAMQDNFKKTYLFELSAVNYKVLLSRVDGLYCHIRDKIITVNSGVAGETEEIYYDENDEGSGLSDDGDTKGHVVSLDDYFKTEEVTFIKMDIEGAESMALQGAQKLIKRCSPRLAICLYHKPQDLWELPMLMKQLNPDYKLYVRHYTDLLNETVCYAIGRNRENYDTGYNE